MEKIAFGERFVVAINESKQVVFWSTNIYGGVHIVEGITNAIGVYVYARHILVMLDDKSVVKLDWMENFDNNHFVVFNPKSYLTRIKNVVQSQYYDTLFFDIKEYEYAFAQGYFYYVNEEGQVFVQNCHYNEFKLIRQLNNIRELIFEKKFLIGIKKDGSIVAFGNNNYGQCTIPENLTNVKSIHITKDYTVIALTFDGRVVVWGNNPYELCNVPIGLDNVIRIEIGRNFIVALKVSGEVVAWGDNKYGQCNVPNGLTDVESIQCNYSVTIAIKRDYTIVIWGDNAYGFCDIAKGMCGVKSVYFTWGFLSNIIVVGWDGKVHFCGILPYEKDKSGLNLDYLEDISHIYMDHGKILAVKYDGSVVFGGNSLHGEKRSRDEYGDNYNFHRNIPEGLRLLEDIGIGNGYLLK